MDSLKKPLQTPPAATRRSQDTERTPQVRGDLFKSSFPRIRPHPRVSLAPGPLEALPSHPPCLPVCRTNACPAWCHFFHGALAVAVHIWSLDSEALPAGPTAQAGPCCPLFAQLKLVNWNWSGLCGWLARQALVSAARSVEHLAGPGWSLGGRRPAPPPPQPLLGVGSDSMRPLWVVGCRSQPRCVPGLPAPSATLRGALFQDHTASP